MAEDSGQIEILNGSRWMGDPWLARLHVYVDGIKVGVAPVSRVLRSTLVPGRYSVHVRLWWIKSEAVTVDVVSGGSVRLQSYATRSGGWFRDAFRAHLSLKPA